jgi:hypothetical protein
MVVSCLASCRSSSSWPSARRRSGSHSQRGARAASSHWHTGCQSLLAHRPSISESVWRTDRQFPSGARAVSPPQAHGPSVRFTSESGSRAAVPRVAPELSVPSLAFGSSVLANSRCPRLRVVLVRVIVPCPGGRNAVGNVNQRALAPDWLQIESVPRTLDGTDGSSQHVCYVPSVRSARSGCNPRCGR